MLLSSHQSLEKARVTKVQRVHRHQSLKVHVNEQMIISSLIEISFVASSDD